MVAVRVTKSRACITAMTTTVHRSYVVLKMMDRVVSARARATMLTHVLTIIAMCISKILIVPMVQSSCSMVVAPILVVQLMIATLRQIARTTITSSLMRKGTLLPFVAHFTGIGLPVLATRELKTTMEQHPLLMTSQSAEIPLPLTPISCKCTLDVSI